MIYFQTGTPLPVSHIVLTTADFGVSSITSTVAGVYTVNLNNAHTFTGGAVIVTPMDPAASAFCGTVVATSVIGDSFTVTVRNNSCDGVNNPFMFQVVGR